MCVARLVLWCVNGRGYFLCVAQSEVGGDERITCKVVNIF